MSIKTIPYDSAVVLTTPTAVAEYLMAAFEDGAPEEITHALGVAARAHGMTDLARATGVSRQHLYKALSAEGRPELATVMAVMKALGMRLQPTLLEA